MTRELFRYLPFVLILLLVFRRAGRSRKVRVERAWLIPLLSVLGVASTLSREAFPSVAALAIFVAAGAIGAGAGYFQALHTELSIAPEGDHVMSKPTQLGSVLIVVLFAVRFGLDYLVKGSFQPGPPSFIPQAPTQHHGVDLFRLADAALIFATALMLGQRLEILRRAHLLLKGAESGISPAS